MKTILMLLICAGLTIPEKAEILEIAEPTAKRHWIFARAYIAGGNQRNARSGSCAVFGGMILNSAVGMAAKERREHKKETKNKGNEHQITAGTAP